MNHNLKNLLAGGVVATTMMTLMMKFMAPMMTGRPMDIAAMIGGMMGNNYALGMSAHLMLGIVAFPLAYSILVYQKLPGSPVMRGMIWGVMLWLVAETMVMPMAGAGLFSANIGGMKAVAAALMGHLVYGGLLGLISGRSVAN